MVRLGTFRASPGPSAKKKRRPRVLSESESESAVEDSIIVKEEPPEPRAKKRSDLNLTPPRNGTSSPASARKSSRLLRSSQVAPKPTPLPVAEDDSQDEDVVPLVTPHSSLPRKRAARRVSSSSSDKGDAGAKQETSESEDEPVQPAKRRRLNRPNLASQDEDSHNTDDNVSSDAEDPAPSSAVKRSSRRTPRTAKQKQMEILRRRKAGETVDENDLESSSAEYNDGGALYDTDSGLEALSEFEDDEEGVAEEEEQAAPSRQRATSQAENDDLDDFIVEDGEGPLGAPHEHLIPLEFTLGARKPLRDHFRDAVEWMVQSRLNPAFERDDEVYVLAFRKLEDEVTGLANSKFTSSSWRPQFSRALRARPYMHSEPVTNRHGAWQETCQACGRKNHPARCIVQFSGRAYYKDSLADIESDDDGGDDDDDDDDDDEAENGESKADSAESEDEGKSVDENGNVVPPQSREWYVGVVCNSNAETAHDLLHWRHALKDWIEVELGREGLLEAEQVVRRDRMSRKERYHAVETVMEGWLATGAVKRLWVEFKDMLEKARNKSTTGKTARPNMVSLG